MQRLALAIAAGTLLFVGANTYDEVDELARTGVTELGFLPFSVERVRTRPSIANILMVPHQLWAEHRLALKAQDLWVYTGKVVSAP